MREEKIINQEGKAGKKRRGEAIGRPKGRERGRREKEVSRAIKINVTPRAYNGTRDRG